MMMTKTGDRVAGEEEEVLTLSRLMMSEDDSSSFRQNPTGQAAGGLLTELWFFYIFLIVFRDPLELQMIVIFSFWN